MENVYVWEHDDCLEYVDAEKEETYRGCRDWDTDELGAPKESPPLKLLRTCRTLYYEASEVLYETNTFAPADLSNGKLFLKGLTPQRRRLLRSLHLELDFQNEHDLDDWKKALPLYFVRQLTGPRTLHVNIVRWFSTFGATDVVRKSIEGSTYTHSMKQLVIDEQVECVLRFRLLDLESATVVLEDKSLDRDEFSPAEMVEWAQSVERRLLDPKSVAKYEEARKGTGMASSAIFRE